MGKNSIILCHCRLFLGKGRTPFLSTHFKAIFISSVSDFIVFPGRGLAVSPPLIASVVFLFMGMMTSELGGGCCEARAVTKEGSVSELEELADANQVRPFFSILVSERPKQPLAVLVENVILH